jgi:hypothetical protein
MTPKPKGYWRKRARMLESRVKSLECERDALQAELAHAVETMPPKRLARYVIEREARGGPCP